MHARLHAVFCLLTSFKIPLILVSTQPVCTECCCTYTYVITLGSPKIYHMVFQRLNFLHATTHTEYYIQKYRSSEII